MKEFIEKLIGRLEETRWTTIFDTSCIFENDKLDKCIAIVNELAEEHKGGWIPCSERLPDDFMSMEYLTTVKGRFYSEINYYCVVNHKWYSNERTTKEVNVIAWMPKPTVYQPKGE